MRKFTWMLLPLLAAVLASGCVFVQPTEEGKKVRVLTAGEVKDCRSLGKLTSQVSNRIAAIPRSREAVQEDVLANAKNSAADMNGDTIVPVTDMEDGKQSFNVYRCLAP